MRSGIGGFYCLNSPSLVLTIVDSGRWDRQMPRRLKTRHLSDGLIGPPAIHNCEQRDQVTGDAEPRSNLKLGMLGRLVFEPSRCPRYSIYIADGLLSSDF